MMILQIFFLIVLDRLPFVLPSLSIVISHAVKPSVLLPQLS